MGYNVLSQSLGPLHRSLSALCHTCPQTCCSQFWIILTLHGNFWVLCTLSDVLTCHGTLRALSTWSCMAYSEVTAHCNTVTHRYSKCIMDDGLGYPYVAVHMVIQHIELSEIQSAQSYIPTFMVHRYPGSTTILLQYCTVLTVKMCCNTSQCTINLELLVINFLSPINARSSSLPSI